MKRIASLARLAVKLLICFLLAQALAVAPAYAQRAQGAVMESVFFNVVWGSALGAVLGVSTAVLGAKDASAPNELRQATFSGASLGGLIGLGVGLFLIYNGVLFDETGSPFLNAQGEPVSAGYPLVSVQMPSFSLETSTSGPFRITGFSARVLDLRF